MEEEEEEEEEDGLSNVNRLAPGGLGAKEFKGRSTAKT